MTRPTELQRESGKARAASAVRGSAGQFFPAETQPKTQPGNPATREGGSPTPPPRSSSDRRKPKTVGLRLTSIDVGGEWWEALSAQYPNVNLHAELLKALDWHGADRVKSPKLFFRNWIERASLSAPTRDLTPDEIRARLRVAS